MDLLVVEESQELISQQEPSEEENQLLAANQQLEQIVQEESNVLQSEQEVEYEQTILPIRQEILGDLDLAELNEGNGEHSFVKKGEDGGPMYLVTVTPIQRLNEQKSKRKTQQEVDVGAKLVPLSQYEDLGENPECNSEEDSAGYIYSRPSKKFDISNKDKLLPFALKCIKCGEGFRKVAWLKEHQSACTKIKKEKGLHTVTSIQQSYSDDEDEAFDNSYNMAAKADDGMQFDSPREKGKYLKTLYKQVVGGYQCRYCEKVYNKPYNVEQHERCHTGFRPFECDLCGAKFAQKGARNVHRRKVLCKTPIQRSMAKTNHPKNLQQHQDDLNTQSEYEKIEDVDGGGYKCRFCELTCDRPYNVLVHERSHTGDRPYVCENCPLTFASLSSCNLHLREGRCKADNEQTLDAYLNKQKMREENRQKYKKIAGLGFQCRHCEMTFEKPYAVMIHERTHTGERPFDCDSCGFRFTQKNSLEKHMKNGTCKPADTESSGKRKRKVKTEPNDNGEEETAGDSDSPSSSQHPRRNVRSRYLSPSEKDTVVEENEIPALNPDNEGEDEKEADDDMDEEVSDAVEAIAGSVKTEGGEVVTAYGAYKQVTGGRYECPHCYETFSRMYHVRRHELTHQNKHRSHKCGCGLSFTQRQFVAHRTGGYGGCPYAEDDGVEETTADVQDVQKDSDTAEENEHKCKRCKRVFKSQASLKLHLQKCQFKCSTCNRLFAKRGQLEVHVRTHTGHRPFCCKVCGDKFTQRSHYVRHRRIHTGDKPYACDECGLKFLDSSARRHHELHKHEAKYDCDECSDVFTTIPRLKLHKVSHSHDQLYRCEHCHKAFKTMVSLHIHEAMHRKKETLDLRKPQKDEEIIAEFDDDAASAVADEDFESDVAGARVAGDILQPGEDEASEKQEKKPAHKCEHCELTFTTFHRLHAHQRVHTIKKEDDVETFCEKCGDLFPNFRTYHRHKRHADSKCNPANIAKNSRKTQFYQYECETCKQTFSGKNKLEKHKQLHLDTSRHECEECGKSFKHMVHLRQHHRLHTGVGVHKCDRCDKVFYNSTKLRMHYYTHTGDGPLHCPECPKRYADRTELRNHVACQHREKEFKCEKCVRSFGLESLLDKHRLVHTESWPNKCTHCCKGFRTQRQVEIHERTHTGERPFGCTIEGCPMAFTQLSHLTRHLVTHTGERPYQCTACYKAYTDPSSLKKHMLVTHDLEKDGSKSLKEKKTFVCDTCGRSFKSEMTLIEHSKVAHQGVIYECNLCGKNLSSKKGLEIHRLLHDESNRTFVCPFANCKMRFITKGSLQQHIISHSDERPYQCDQCEKAYKKSSGLQEHILASHSTERPYICEVCNKAFYGPRPLRNHYRIHTGEKPYSCSYCGKGFVQICQVRRHEKVHTGEKPFKCTYCDKRFADNSGKRDHETTHTGVKPATCERCGQGFVRKHDLRVHILKRHAEELDDEEWMEINAKKTVVKKPKLQECSACGQSFFKKSTLKNHMAKRHPMVNYSQTEVIKLVSANASQDKAPISLYIKQKPPNMGSPLHQVELRESVLTASNENEAPTIEVVNSEVAEMDGEQRIMVQYDPEAGGAVLQYIAQDGKAALASPMIQYVDEHGNEVKFDKGELVDETGQVIEYVDEQGNRIELKEEDGQQYVFTSETGETYSIS